MSKKFICSWLDRPEHRARLHDYLSILRAGSRDELAKLPDDFLREWKSSGSGAGALHYVASHGECPDEVVPFLIGRGLDPNALSAKGAAVLAHALNRKKEETLAWCQALVAAGARIEKMPCKGVSVLLAGVQANRPELVEMAVRAGATRNYPDDPQFLHKPLPDERKIFVSSPDKPLLPGPQALEDLLPASQEDLDRQLLVSARLGYFDWAEHFLSRGASLRSRTASGDTLLHVLAERLATHRISPVEGCQSLVRRAAAAGAGLHETNVAGYSALDVLAVEWELPERVDWFRRQVSEGHAEGLSLATAAASGTRYRPRF